MRSIRDIFRQSYDVRFTTGFEDRLILEVARRVGNKLDQLSQQLVQMEKKLMATAQDLQAKMDALKAEVARNTDVDASIKAALDGQTTMVADLKTQIEALKNAGAGAVTQEQLDALDASAGDTLNTLKANNDDLASKVTANTPVA